jgi:predicted ATPase
MAARPAPTEPIPERVVVIGCAGSGKTTLARALAVRLDARHIERDALGDDEAPSFATQVAAAIDARLPWVFDGAPTTPSYSESLSDRSDRISRSLSRRS